MQATLIQPVITKNPVNLDTPVTSEEKNALKRRGMLNYKKRVAYWFDYQTGEVILPNNRVTVIELPITFDELLNRVYSHASKVYASDTEVNLMLRSGRLVSNRPYRNWFTTSNTWVSQEDRFIWKHLQGLYQHKDSSFKVNLYSTSGYCGEEQDMFLCKLAMEELETEIASKFHLENYSLRPTPASTGRDLLEMSLPFNKEYKRLPQDIRDIILHNFGQGRVETLSPKKNTVKNAYVLDGRWMYASCVSHIPNGLCYHDNWNEFLGVVTSSGKLLASYPGFYRVEIEVPQGWYHIGLIKASSIDDTAIYPNKPGTKFTNWCSAHELALALENKWNVTILERIIFPCPEGDMIATLRKHLVDMRESQAETQLGKIKAGAIRSILLHLIGSFHQQYTLRERFTPSNESIPDTARIKGNIKSTVKGTKWVEEIKLPNREAFNHPEISADIWGKARARLAAYALRLPYESIISMRTDSIWTDFLPTWIEDEDKGKPGTFRLKETTSSFTWPINEANMRGYIITHNKLQGETFIDELEEMEG